ncbi:doublecortin domain-containing protein 1 [Mixophyes fleayi]|uniref:doublecortin domain-containing protein 1 n=1 Tax=Mixophyes fleayi TaxID=3061075 RepID=UPI003F4E3E4D
MAGHKELLSAFSAGRRLSTTSLHGTYLSSTARSRPRSLEDVIVGEYLDEIERPATAHQFLPRSYKTPYAKKSARRRQDSLFGDEPMSGPTSPSLSVCVSRRSTSQDCSSLQKASVQGSNVVSHVNPEKSDITDNPSLSSRSKRNRPASAPQGHLRCSVRKHHSSSGGGRGAPVFKRQPWVIRATAYKNGSHSTAVKVSAPTIPLFLERCTVRLKLNMAARRVFLSDGTEAFEPKDIPHDTDVYISTGEPFTDPLKNVKDNALLSSKLTWTMNGLILPSDWKIGKTKPAEFKHFQKLSTNSTGRILVFVNGNGQDDHVITVTLDDMEGDLSVQTLMIKFLDQCTSKVGLGSSAKWVFDINGEKVEDLRNIPLLDKCLQNSIICLRGPVWLSKGEGFSPTGVKIYIQGVLSALRQRLKSSKNFCHQIQHYMNGQTDEISRKEIFPMTEEELYTAHEEVNELIDELKTAIKVHRGQFFKLAPQLQAEQEQCATYLFQHIKPLPSSSNLPPSLRLKVFENGTDYNATLVFISSKEMQKCYGTGAEQSILEFLRIIEERLQRSTDFGVLGLRLSRLFDEKGQEIKKPQSLQNEQKVWVSCGEDYRPPADSVLVLSCDKVICTEEGERKVIHKALLDLEAYLPGYGSWNVCSGFPDNVLITQLQSLHVPEIVDVDGLFLQSSVDLQMVLYPSVMVQKRRRAPGQLRKNGQVESALLSSNIWLITKAGMILSKVMPQVCLAVGQPILLSTRDGSLLHGYRLTLQKRGRNNSGQIWSFGNKGSIFSKAYPEFVLTHLEELNIREVVNQIADRHIEHGIWPSAHWDTDTTSATEHESQPLAAQPSPAGNPGESRQLTVALVRILVGKHPKASAQRWAIKHEGLSKCGQWKRSKVDNPLWNKLTYLWPVLPNGDINEDFNWPLQGSLIANSPPLDKPRYDHPDTHTPVRLNVLRNGDGDQSKAYLIVGPNLSNMLKKHRTSEKKQIKQLTKENNVKEDSTLKLDEVELQQFLERCTQIMNLPSAARRLYNENGTEIFRLRDAERDQQVYVSCGEQWIDPQLSAAEHKKQILLSNLTSDVSLIRHYFSLRNSENLVLEVNGDIVAGAKLMVNYCAVQTTNEDSGNEETKEESIVEENDLDECVNSHTRTHRRIDALITGVRYPWQQVPPDEEKDNGVVTGEDLRHKDLSTYGYPRKLQQIHLQQFEYVDGQIVNSALPDLVLGVTDIHDIHAGAEILLVHRNADDLGQCWKYREDNRTFHLAGNTDLVLAVSLPKMYPGLKETDMKLSGCPIILQKYEEHINGAANQKWCYIDSKKVLSAFYSDQQDVDITAANHISICTFTVTNAEEISQPGYILMSPTHNEGLMTCVSCARTLRSERELRKVTAGALFSCASGRKDSNLNPWDSLNVFMSERPIGSVAWLEMISAMDLYLADWVFHTDLSMSEAQNTLHYLRGVLSSMRFQLGHTIAQDISVARSQRAVKVKAFRNGDNIRNGRLLIARSFPELLTMCTRELDLPRPACRLYTADGTVILQLSSLIAWAANDFLKQNEEHTENEVNHRDNQRDLQTLDETSAITPVHPEVSTIDDYLLSYILRHPIDVWVSCGEPYLLLQAVERSEEEKKMHWLQKKKILSGRNLMKHKVRHLQGRRVQSLAPPSMVPTRSPAQPVLVEGGWTEVTNEELKLREEIENVETHLSDMQVLRPNIHPVVAKSRKALYNLPAMKRVLAYINGGSAEHAVYAWGKSLEELLDDCTLKLSMQHQPAAAVYGVTGEQVTAWDDITKDALLCVSAGEPFITKKASREKIKVRADYARTRKKYGPGATDVIISTPSSLY